MKRKNNLNYPKSAAIGFLSKGLKREFETAVVNEPSVFEPLKFYCTEFTISTVNIYNEDILCIRCMRVSYFQLSFFFVFFFLLLLFFNICEGRDETIAVINRWFFCSLRNFMVTWSIN